MDSQTSTSLIVIDEEDANGPLINGTVVVEDIEAAAVAFRLSGDEALSVKSSPDDADGKESSGFFIRSWQKS